MEAFAAWGDLGVLVGVLVLGGVSRMANAKLYRALMVFSIPLIFHSVGKRSAFFYNVSESANIFIHTLLSSTIFRSLLAVDFFAAFVLTVFVMVRTRPPNSQS